MTHIVSIRDAAHIAAVAYVYHGKPQCHTVEDTRRRLAEHYDVNEGDVYIDLRTQQFIINRPLSAGWGVPQWHSDTTDAGAVPRFQEVQEEWR